MTASRCNPPGWWLTLALSLLLLPVHGAAQDDDLLGDLDDDEPIEDDEPLDDEEELDAELEAGASGELELGLEGADGLAEAPPPEAPEPLLGTRASRHRVPHGPVPVRVLSGAELAFVNDVDLIHAAGLHGVGFDRLRGLGPDRVVVLINGKRRHQMAQVVTDERIGKGSSGVDLNAIPIAAIERIEILSDGAGAHYGPNAIGGVINIVLKERPGVSLGVSGGNYYDNDGNALLGLDRVTASVNAGVELGERGFLNGTVAVRDRGETNRAGIATVASTVDGRAFGGNWWQVDETCPPDEFIPEEVPPCKQVRRLRFGNQDGQDLYLLLNAGYEMTDSVELYGFGGASHRTGETGAGLFLGNGSGRVPAELYPDGFLPSLTTTVVDASATAGVRFEISDPWELDISAGFGRSSFTYDVANSANISWFYEINPATGEIYADTPTEANAGELINTEITANADLTGKLDVLAGLDIGIGIELRQDNYTIERGDPVSYAYGRNNIVDPANPIRNTSSFPLVADAVGGIQGFPGFGPTAEVDDGRTAWDFYVDAGQHLTDWWLLGAGARVQNTEFTGMAIVGKVSTRVQATDALSFRASAGNGSRSPGVQQIYYSQRMTAILPAGLTETVTVGDANPLRVAFGMGQLDPETSLSASAGASFQTDDLGDTLRSLLLSADVYQVLIDDRIVLSESVTGEIPAGEVDTPGRQAFRDLLVDNQLGAAQFFVNGIDTKTVGLDVGSGFGLGFGDVGLDLFGEVHYSETSIEASDPQSDLVEGVDLFGPIQRNRVEKGQPRWTATLGQTTHYDILSFNLAFDYVGSVTGKYYMALEDEKVWSGKWLTSASISIEPVEQLIVTVGGSNIFDVFPDEWGMVGREYPEIGYTYGLETLPFGVNGGFYYAALEYTL